MFTESIAQKMHRIQSEVAIQSLYSTVGFAIRESNISEEVTDGKDQEFEGNMYSLIKLLSENNNIRAQELTRLLIPLIYKVLSTNESELAQMKIPKIIKNEAAIRETLVNIHNICQNGPYRSLLCKIQAVFSTECILNTKEPGYELRKQLQLWQFNLSKSAGAAQPANATPLNIENIKAKIRKVDEETEKATRFCETYRVSPK
jgi:hypothetical protein